MKDIRSVSPRKKIKACCNGFKVVEDSVLLGKEKVWTLLQTKSQQRLCALLLSEKEKGLKAAILQCVFEYVCFRTLTYSSFFVPQNFLLQGPLLFWGLLILNNPWFLCFWSFRMHYAGVCFIMLQAGLLPCDNVLCFGSIWSRDGFVIRRS